MNRKIIIVLVGLGILIIGSHLIAANILSDRIEKMVQSHLVKPQQNSVSIQEVTIQPFRGNIAAQNFSYGVKDQSHQLNISQAGIDLTYYQLWQLYLQNPMDYILALEQIPLTASGLQFSNQNLQVGIAESYLTAFPTSRISRSSSATLKERLSKSIRLTTKMHEMSWSVKNPLSSSLVDSIKPHILTWSRVTSKLLWNAPRRTLQIDTLAFHSSKAKLNLQGNLRINNSAGPAVLSSLDLNLSYKPAFSVQFSKGLGSFSGTHLSWQARIKNQIKLRTNIASISGGRHKANLEHFSWIPPASIREKLYTIPGGQSLFKNGVSGKDLKLSYHYDPGRHALQLHNLSFSSRHYRFQAQGRLTIDPRHPGNGYIRNIHITIDEISEPLTQVLHQFENVFGFRIFKDSDESIELYLQGRLTDPEWKLL